MNIITEYDGSRWVMLEDVEKLIDALKEYANKENWGYYDNSGYPKGYGKYEDACFIGRETAINILKELDL